MAAKRRVLFIEEPTATDAVPHWELKRPEENLLVCRPHIHGASRWNNPLALQQMLHDLLRDQCVDNYVAWLYTPMALPLAKTLTPRAVIYDCMDELSMFLGAPRELLERESQLFDWADVVFTGGPSLFRAKQPRHPNVHCFPSSVDAAHFGQAKNGHVNEPADQASLPHPRLGFFGVIDERMDIVLLDAIARAHPEWQMVMIGPTIKIDPGHLPRHANIHYLNQKSYNELPLYLSGWDVALLPFAQNDATKFISPTKTLEYMAAEKPIVSTPITDVAEPYGDIVYLGATQQEFIKACERALNASPEERAMRAAKMRLVLAKTSWDTTARAMEQQIERVIKDARKPGKG